MAERTGERGVSPARFQQLVGVTTVLLTLIIATGAAVRLTQSGLGCNDWPGCTSERFVPEWAFHHWVEFGNRLLSGAAGIPTIALVVAAHLRTPVRRDLKAGAWAILAGVLAQVVIGKVVVQLDLQPLAVALHYLVSIFILWVGLWLWFRADPEGRWDRPVPRAAALRSRMTIALALLTVTVGTLVTGTGPHGGDSQADRLTMDLQAVARLHSASAWLLVASVLALAFHLGPTRRLQWLLGLIVAQGGIGYAQYALGVPAGLVELHVIGSAVVFGAVLAHHFSLGDGSGVVATDHRGDVARPAAGVAR